MAWTTGPSEWWDEGEQPMKTSSSAARTWYDGNQRAGLNLTGAACGGPNSSAVPGGW